MRPNRFLYKEDLSAGRGFAVFNFHGCFVFSLTAKGFSPILEKYEFDRERRRGTQLFAFRLKVERIRKACNLKSIRQGDFNSNRPKSELVGDPEVSRLACALETSSKPE